MTGSIPSKLLPIALALGCLAASGAYAQTQAPTKLLPLPDQADSLKPPLNSGPSSTIKVDQLAPADPEGFGLADPRETLFGTRQWYGTSRAMAVALLARLPAPAPSPVLHQLERRLLAAPATPPAGEADTSLIGLRAAKLAALGDSQVADTLVHMIPAKLEDEPVAHLAQDQLWLANKSAEACDALDHDAAQFRGAYWQQNRVACQAIAGQKNESQLGANLLRDQGIDDPVFYALIDGWGASKQTALPAGALTPLNAALAIAAKRDVPATLMSNADVRVAAALAISTTMPAPVRILAAERAASAGAIDSEALAQAYLATEPTSAELNKFAGVVKSAPSAARARALLYRGIKIEPSPPERADLIGAALEATRGSDLYAPTVFLYVPYIAQLHPTDALAGHVLDFGRALLVAGDIDQARTWFEFGRSLSGDRGNDEVRLWAYARLAGIKDAAVPDVKAFQAWREADAIHDADASAGRRALLMAMFSGLGEVLPGDAYLPLADPAQRSIPIVPNALALAQMRDAAANPRLAEAASLALINSGGRAGGPGDVIVIGAVLSSLRAVGLEVEARAYAVEVAAASGL